MSKSYTIRTAGSDNLTERQIQILNLISTFHCIPKNLFGVYLNAKSKNDIEKVTYYLKTHRRISIKNDNFITAYNDANTPSHYKNEIAVAWAMAKILYSKNHGIRPKDLATIQQSQKEQSYNCIRSQSVFYELFYVPNSSPAIRSIQSYIHKNYRDNIDENIKIILVTADKEALKTIQDCNLTFNHRIAYIEFTTLSERPKIEFYEYSS